ncbi:MAG TPA: valine--tRNA ligase [Flavobacteriaceae bacterium]|nr:valine--tRNA ligase [Flavobacteriaceae bacterium]MCB9213604.1 valine--tRNA ligase [Alteromonas sp.]HPF12105.1 valine--tRNA ligase [Flavobacteriaceae bacterium]HQU21464.1 valine--tRNA ligase [Flavobacteriaceae bacterium]HQU65614.1 valine--tRNA ligase [Flavobacteriaceae bacterium]
MALEAKYPAKQVEDRWYQYWMEHGFFHSEVDGRTPYTIVIPPPNVTGVLHMGHMLNNTIQDVLIRRARLKGYNACWVPGTDHASIATEAKVVAKLKAEGIEKGSLTREQFLDHAWEWTHKHGGIILEQLKKLGASCDWERTKFTMDDALSASVIRVFVDLYRKGEIYRGYRMVNWDPQAKTTLSDEEVIYEERQGNLYYLNYTIEGDSELVTIATTRPETILGDTAICINPNDERYTHLKGKRAIVPICNRSIPIIEDEYVTMEFGTGCLKVTPAHDENDKALGDKHQLEVVDIFNDDGTLNGYGLHYKGKDRFEVRDLIVEELKQLGVVSKIEQHLNKVGTSERTGAVIEPKLSDQWFLKMKILSQPALEAVVNNEVHLVPDKFINTYRHWMENVRDWNISRQLWWGHQIPAYYYGDGKDEFVVAETLEEAVSLAQEKSGNPKLTKANLTQDPDVLDTWFSSWLWPISVFNGILEPNNKEINYYYPTNDLVTAPEILFFWVARMIIAGYEYRGEKPFSNVYLTGIVRDKLRRKMSKSLGNSPDPIELIDRYGADGVRVGMLLSSPAGNDLMFDEDLCKQGSGFLTKIWNAYRLIDGWEVSESQEPSQGDAIAIKWFQNKFQKALQEIEDHFGKYRISDALMTTYKLIWDDFCSWLLEMIKPTYGEPMSKSTYDSVVSLLEGNLKILHPFIPFITEEIWQHLSPRKPNEALIVASWPVETDFDAEQIKAFEFASEVISGIRTIRKEKNLSFKESISLYVINHENASKNFDTIIQKLGNVSEIQYASEKLDGALTFRVKSNEYFIPVAGAIDVAAEIEKLKEELSYTEGFLKSVQGKLKNERFVNNAPEQVVAMERQKEADALAKIETLKASLQGLQ